MSHDVTPGSVRIRTDDGNEWRYDAIKKAAAFYVIHQLEEKASTLGHGRVSLHDLHDGIDRVLID